MIELLNNRSILSFKGPDSLKFMQTMVTNDIVKNDYSYNYLLSPQGRYLYDFFIIKNSDDDFLIDIHSSCSNSMQQKLNFYKLRMDVKIEDLSTYKVLYAHSAPKNMSDLDIIYRDPRFKKLGFRIITNHITNDIQNDKNDLYVTDKYHFAIPDGVDDLAFERSIPTNFGIEELNGVSFSKGCYVGQEVISRAKYQGVVRKKIFKLVSENIILPVGGKAIFDLSGNKIGSLCSSKDNLGIALLNEEKYFELPEKIAMIDNLISCKIFVPKWRNNLA